MNPANWIVVGNRIRRERPDLIVVRFWLPFMGPALGTILRIVRKNKQSRIIAITDNVIPHEKRFGDKSFTRYFLKACDAYITMSEKVMKDLRTFNQKKPAKQVLHPLYDNFGEPVPKSLAREKLGIDANGHLVLFFGFIRKYKGLDILLQAIKLLADRHDATQTEIPKLLIAGEFYEDAKPYEALIERLGISQHLILRTSFIPDSDVKYYLCAADLVVQPYRNATQSGVTPLAYHFEKPMVVTNVGSLPDLVPHLKSGLVAEPDAPSIATAIQRYFELGENYFIPHLRSEKQKYSWSRLLEAITTLANDIQK